MSEGRDRARTGRAAARKGRLLRSVPRGAACLTLLAAWAVGARAQVPPPPAAQRADSLAPRTVTGRVVRPGQSGTIPVPSTWVTLHRVAPDSSGPVDSVRADASGQYRIRYTPRGGDAVYFASSMFGGIAYFTAPLPASDAGGDAGEITVFDTTSAPVRINTRGRHLVVSASATDGRRTLVEVFELSNDTTVTAVAGARGRATWSTPVAPNATSFQAGQSDISGNAMQLRDGRVLVFASIAPGIRQVAFSYSVPAEDFPLAVPVADSVSVFEVLVEDRGASATGGTLAEQPSVSLEGRTFRRFLGQDIAPGTPITIDVGAPTALRGNRYLFVPVFGAAVLMSVALAIALTRRRRVPALVAAAEPPDAAHLARDIAELDDQFAQIETPSDGDRASYQRRREVLKSRLAAALAKEETTV